MASQYFCSALFNCVTDFFFNRRWSFYILSIWSALLLLGTAFFVPETYHPVLIRRKSQRLRKETSRPYYAPIERMDKTVTTTVLHSMTRPFQLLLLDPMCLCLCLYTAVIIGIVYMFFGAIPLIFSNNHNFELYQVGLAFIGMLVGTAIGAATDPIWSRNYRRLAAQHVADGGDPEQTPPEFRLPPAIVGAFLVTTGLFWFGWTTYKSIHWIVPILGSMVYSIGYVFSDKEFGEGFSAPLSDASSADVLLDFVQIAQYWAVQREGSRDAVQRIVRKPVIRQGQKLLLNLRNKVPDDSTTLSLLKAERHIGDIRFRPYYQCVLLFLISVIFCYFRVQQHAIGLVLGLDDNLWLILERVSCAVRLENHAL